MMPRPRTARLQSHPGHPLLAFARLWDAAPAAAIFDQLNANIPWSDGNYQVAGRRISLGRCQCWYSDPGVPYRYHDQLQNAHHWTPLLESLRASVEHVTGLRFNAVLANLYRDGLDRVNWHADDDEDLGAMAQIASLSFGATRRFAWRPKPGVQGLPDETDLAPGTLLLMRAPFQRDFEHAVPPEHAAIGPRLNLTFRQVRVAR